MAGLVVLVRHAEREFAPDVDDSQQVLTPKGIQSVKRLGALLAAKFSTEGVTVSKILTSPYVRAEATAQGLVEALGLPPTAIETWDILGQDAVKAVIATMEQLTPLVEASDAAIMLVGHKPTLAELGYRLSAEETQLRKSEVAAIVITQTEPELRGTLEWQMHYKEGLTYQRDEED